MFKLHQLTIDNFLYLKRKGVQVGSTTSYDFEAFQKLKPKVAVASWCRKVSAGSDTFRKWEREQTQYRVVGDYIHQRRFWHCWESCQQDLALTWWNRSDVPVKSNHPCFSSFTVADSDYEKEILFRFQ